MKSQERKLSRCRRIRRTFLICALLLPCYVSSLAPQLMAAEKISGRVTCTYDLLAEGKDIGDITITRESGIDANKQFVRIEESCAVKVSGFWGHWEMTSTSKIVADSQGLLSFDHKVSKNNKKWRVFGERHDQELWCSARKVLTMKEKDEEDVVGLSTMVAAETIPYVGEALTVLGLLAGNGDSEGEFRIPLNSFDSALCMLPYVLLFDHNDIKNRKVRILDTTELETKDYMIEEVSPEQIEIAGQTFRCRVFNAAKPKWESTSWLAEDELGGFLVKESGKDEDGPYEIILKQYKNESKNKR